MAFTLAFSNLKADAPRQRARCSASGRFVAWARVPHLRAVGAPRVVVVAAPLGVVADGAEVAPVAEAPPLGIGSALPIVARGFVAFVVAGVRSLVATARAAVVVAGLALGGGGIRTPRRGWAEPWPATTPEGRCSPLGMVLLWRSARGGRSPPWG